MNRVLQSFKGSASTAFATDNVSERTVVRRFRNLCSTGKNVASLVATGWPFEVFCVVSASKLVGVPAMTHTQSHSTRSPEATLDATPLKILFITQYFYPENFSNNKVVRNLVARGHEVTVYTAIPNYPEGKFYDGYGFMKRKRDTYEGARVERVSIIPRGQTPLQQIANFASFVVSASWRAIRLQRGEYDVVISSAPSPITLVIPAIVASRRLGVPHLAWIQDLWPQSPVELYNIKCPFIIKPLNALCRWIYRNATVLLVISKGFVPEIRKLAPDACIRFFPNFIENIHLPLPRRADLREDFNLDDNDFIVMYVGNIGMAQNVDLLIDAAVLLQDSTLHFVLLGDGRDRGRLEARITELGLNPQFHFVGTVLPEQVAEHLSYADAAALTLRNDPVLEPVVPYRLQTFLGCGMIVLASTEGESRRIVKTANCGFVSDPGDAAQFAQSILASRALSVTERQAMQHNSRRYALENYDETQVMNSLSKVLDDVVPTPVTSRTRRVDGNLR